MQVQRKVEDKRIIKLIGLTLRSGVMVSGNVEPTPEGTTQGSPLSPLLSNIVLDELDKELEKRGLELCRFADDCNIFVRTRKAAEYASSMKTWMVHSICRSILKHNMPIKLPTCTVRGFSYAFLPERTYRVLLRWLTMPLS